MKEKTTKLHYIYTHSLDGVVRYVGQGIVSDNPKKRCKAFSKNHRGKNWHDVFDGHKPEVTIVEDNIPDELIKAKERYYIDLYGGICEGSPLVNLKYPMYYNSDEEKERKRIMRNKRSKTFYLRHKEKVLTRTNTEYYKKKRRENFKKYYEKNRELILTKMKNLTDEQKEKIRLKNRLSKRKERLKKRNEMINENT